MSILSCRISPSFFATAVLMTAIPVYSQEFFREFGTSRTSGGIGRITPSAEVFSGNIHGGPLSDGFLNETADEEKYNLRIGLIDFVLAAGIGVEFNDNITLANSDEISDIIIRPEVNIEGIVRFSELNTLRFGLGIGYAKYIDNSQFDSESVIVSPTSSLVWSAKSGNFTFTVRERLSYQEDPFDLPVIRNTANYRRWENQAGFEIDWAASDYSRVSVGYDRFDLWTTDEEFSSQDRVINTVFIRPSVDINPNVTVGLNGSLSWIDYSEDIQADGQVTMVGPYVQVKISDATEVYLEVGWQQSDFDGGTLQTVTQDLGGVEVTNVVEDTEDSQSFYFKAQVTNRPTDYFRHSFLASRTTETGLGSNFYDLYHFEYNADWTIAEKTSISPTLFYEYYETSGADPEEASRLGLALGIHHQLSESLTIGLDYRFLMKNSNLPNADYKQNLGMLSLYYKF